MLYYLSVGTLLGLSAGIAPGPLLTLVISESLRAGIRAGIAVALAPLLTDIPIVLVSVLALARLSAYDTVLGIVSIAGGLFVLSMGVDNLRARGVAADSLEKHAKPLVRGVLVNALSPHPYLFWLTVGAPTAAAALRRHPLAAAAFVGSFYLLLVGSKIACAIVVGKTRAFLTGRVYLFIMRFLGGVLCVLAIVLLRDGWRRLHVGAWF